MKPSELAKYRFSGDLPSPVELEGTLIASDNHSHLIDDAEFSPDPCFGILLPEGFIERLAHLQIPPMVGSAVDFVGQATFVCDVWHTGYRMLPYRMIKVYEFTYEDKHVGKHSFHVSYVAYDVYIISPKQASASTLKALLPHFERRFTIMELRQFLGERDNVLLHRALEGEQLFAVEQRLQEIGVKFELRRPPKGKEWSQQYKELTE